MSVEPCMPPPAASAPAEPRAPVLPVYDVGALFGHANEIRLQYRGTEYRLRLTRNDKLILTK